MTETKEKKTSDIKKEADEISCPVKRAVYFVDEFLKGPMCGKCFPCEMGSYEALVRLRGIEGGSGAEDDLGALRRIAGEMLKTSRCKKGKDTANFIIEWIDTDVFAGHIQGVCADKECMALVEYVVIPDKCTNCALCHEACKDNAITGEKAATFLSEYVPFEISQERCTKCGECIKVCPEEAIELIDVMDAEGVEV